MMKHIIGCVSTQRHKRVSNVGFANRDFSSLSLKKIDAFQLEVNDLTNHAIRAVI